MKALVVDDSRAMRSILSKTLQDLGFSDVAQAKDGKEGLDYLVGHPDTELALVDWNMPEMTGIEMVEAVRQQQALAAVKLVMVTTETEMSHMQSALDMGANEYVMKPFTKDVIVDKLRLLGF
jgi:two-component system chemotaxis response regulator CheY